MYPQRDAIDDNPLMGGYGYLDWNGAGCFHPGVDFNSGGGGNADCGSPVVAIAPMRLARHVESATGYGLHQYWRLTDGPYVGCYVLYAHLESTCHREGDEVLRGATIGTVGRSGGWEHCHLHFEVHRQKPIWGYWPKNQPREAVAAQYHDPIVVCRAYDVWATEDDVITDREEKAVLHAIDESSYPVTEVPDLIRAAAQWGANAASLAGWIEEIGALKARVAELEAALHDAHAAGVDPNAKAPDE
jgi:murein DD-endopeptidase MepM/ murein hydrolase activator NlpD